MNHLKQRFIILIVITFIIVMAYYLTYITLEYQYTGISAKNNNKSWVITEIDPMGWAKIKGMAVGDIVEEINNQDPGSNSILLKYGIIEKIQSIRIIHNGKETIYHTNNQEVIYNQIIHHTFFPMLVFTFTLILSWFLYIRKRKDSSVFVLILFLLTVSLSYLSAGGSARGDGFSKIVVGTTFLLVPVLFLHFLYSYFKVYQIRLFNPILLKVLYIIVGIFTMFQFIFVNQYFASLYSIIRIYKLGFFSSALLLSLYIVTSRYIHYRKTRYKPILKILAFGMTCAFFPFIFLVAIPRILLGNDNEFIPGAVAGSFLIILPITFIYLILANRLFDIDFFLNRIRYYSFLAIFPTILLTGGIHTIIGTNLPISESVQIFMLLYSMMLLVQYLKEQLSYQLRRNLFTEKYNFQASLDRFSQDLSFMKKASDIEARLIKEVKEVLDVRGGSVFEIQKSDSAIHRTTGEARMPVDHVMHKLGRSPERFAIGEFIDLESKHGACIRIGEKRGSHYFLWFGEKVTRTQFNLEERTWLKTIAHYVNMVIKNIHLIEGLVEELSDAIHKNESSPPWVSRLIFNLSEKERRSLSSDLHDSALQEQLLWYRKLEGILRGGNIPHEMRSQLEPIKEGLLDVIYQIRETCNELRPAFITEMGLVEALENLLEYTRLRTDYSIHFQARDFEDRLDDEQALALYRIIQELLTNAAKHSKATMVEIDLSGNDGNIQLDYRDNGVGINLSDLKPSFSHMGLTGIQERVRCFHGSILFHSAAGEGLEVSISIPVHMSKGFATTLR